MSTTREKIQTVIEEQIRPALAMHGGDIEFLGFDESTGKAQIRLTGACGGCPFAEETLRMQVESVLKEAVPEVTQVEKE